MNNDLIMNGKALADLMILLDVDDTDTRTIAWITLMIPRTEIEIQMYCNNDFMVDTYVEDTDSGDDREVYINGLETIYSDNYINTNNTGKTIVRNGGELDNNIDDGSNTAPELFISSVYTFPPEFISVLEDLIILAYNRRGAEGKLLELVGENRVQYEADMPPKLRRELNKRKFLKVF